MCEDVAARVRLGLCRAPAPAAAQQLLCLLPKAKRQALAGVKSEAAFCETVGAWALLSQMLGGPVSGAGQTPAGKPVLAGGPWFSLAHTGGLCFCAVANVPVGIDAERLQKLEYEAAACAVGIAPLPKTQRLFFDAWTAREALLKMTGAPLVPPVRCEKGRIVCASAQGEVRFFNPAPGVRAAVCTPVPARFSRCRVWQLPQE